MQSLKWRSILASRSWLEKSWLENMLHATEDRLVPWLSIGMIAGVVLYFHLRTQRGPEFGLIWVACAVVGCLWARRQVWWGAGYAGLLARSLCLLALVVGVGFTAAQYATWRAPAWTVLPSRAVMVRGIIERIDLLPQGRRLRLGQPQWGDGPVSRRAVQVRLHTDDAAVLAVGNHVQVRALLRLPSAPDWPGAWDYQRDAFFTNLAGSGRALGSVQVQHPAMSGQARHWLEWLRGRIAQDFRAAMPGATGDFATTLLTGEQSSLTMEDRQAFQDSGLAHLLAVAGLHMGIVMGWTFGSVRWLLTRSERASLFWPCKKIAAVAAFLAGGGYMLLTGAHVPTLRSFAMAALVMGGLLCDRRVISLRGLALAAMAILLWAPHEVVRVSFQMSFAAVLALIAGYEALTPWLPHGQGWRWIGRHVTALVLTSLLAGLASMPFAAFYFGRIQLYFVLANLFAVPITALLIMPAGLVALVLMPVGAQGLALIPMRWGLEAVLAIARHVSALPSAAIAVPALNGWGLAILAFGLAWLCLWRGAWRWPGGGLIAIGMVVMACVTPPDVLISADGAMVALRSGHEMRLGTADAQAFVLKSWQQAWGMESPTLHPRLEGQGANWTCTAQACRLGVADPVVLLEQGNEENDDTTPALCTEGRVIVALHDTGLSCPKARLIVDRTFVEHQGATALWLEAPVRVLTDRDVRGERPWVLLGSAYRSFAPDLPMAPSTFISAFPEDPHMNK